MTPTGEADISRVAEMLERPWQAELDSQQVQAQFALHRQPDTEMVFGQEPGRLLQPAQHGVWRRLLAADTLTATRALVLEPVGELQPERLLEASTVARRRLEPAQAMLAAQAGQGQGLGAQPVLAQVAAHVQPQVLVVLRSRAELAPRQAARAALVVALELRVQGPRAAETVVAVLGHQVLGPRVVELVAVAAVDENAAVSPLVG